ncbi:MAG: surface-adhesin E family protein, partial [Burkholderiales bacterium]
MKTRYFPIAVLIIMAGQATGAQWKPVSVTPGRSIFLDVEVLERKGDSVQAWDWQKFASEQTAKTWEGKFYWVKSLSDYDCARRMTAPVLKVYFDAEGAEVKRLPLEGLQFPAVVEPDSLREKLLNLACKSAAAAVTPDAAGKKSQEKKSPAVPTAVPAPAPDASTGKEAAKQPAALKEDAPGAAPLKVAMSAKPTGQDSPAEAATEAAPSHAAAHLSQLPRPRAAPAKRASRRATRSNTTVCADPGAAMASRASIVRKSDAGHSVSHEAHWTYTGDLGADRWGSLKPEYATCANGRQQSPIDISDGARLELEPITFSYAPAALRIIDNGHTIQVNI